MGVVVTVLTVDALTVVELFFVLELPCAFTPVASDDALVTLAAAAAVVGLLIVTVPVAVARVALAGEERTTVKDVAVFQRYRPGRSPKASAR